MSDRGDKIKKLKEVFKLARYAPRDQEGYFDDLDLQGDVGSAIAVVGKEGLCELKEEVYTYLRDPLAWFRAEAVRTLGWDTRLKLAEFRKNKAYQIWLIDQNEDVKTAALTAWAGYYVDTKDPETLKKLYAILASKEYTNQIRAHALKKLFDVADAWKDRREGFDILELGNLEDPVEFENAVNWDYVNKVMHECVPEWGK